MTDPAAQPPAVTRPGTDLERIRDLQPEAVEMLRRHGFVFDKVGPLTDDAAELDRWKVLAFSLYTDIVEASTIAEHIIEREAEARRDSAGLDVERVRVEPFFPNSDGPTHGNAAAFRDYQRRIIRILSGSEGDGESTEVGE